MVNIMGGMVAITPTEPQRRGNARPPRGGALLALGVGAVLIAASATRLWAVLEAEPARAGLERIAKTPEGRVPPDAALAIAQSLASAGRFAPFIVPWVSGDRGGSLEALLRDEAGEASAGAVLARALSQAPSDPHGWLRLARLRRADGDRIGASQALRLSVLAGAVTPGLMVSRLRLGLELYEALDADTQRLLLRQIRLVWMLEPLEVPRLIAEPAYRPIIIAALAEINAVDTQQFRRLNRLDPPLSPGP